MGAREYIRTSLNELDHRLPQFSTEMADAWGILILNGGFPNRYKPIAPDATTMKWFGLLHERVILACQHGPARRRAQALMWTKRALQIAVKRKLDERL